MHYPKKKKKRYHCGGPKPPLKPKKASLKVYLTFSNECYAAIDLSFSSSFGLLQRAENRRDMRLEFGSIDFLVAGNKRRYRASCTTDHMHLLVAVMLAAICLKL